MSNIGDHFDIRGNMYVCGTGDSSTHEVRISFVEGNQTCYRDFLPADLMLLRDLITDGLEELFTKHPEIKCPSCGYTQADAVMHGDHRICCRFPFFPDEVGESEAV